MDINGNPIFFVDYNPMNETFNGVFGIKIQSPTAIFAVAKPFTTTFTLASGETKELSYYIGNSYDFLKIEIKSDKCISFLSKTKTFRIPIVKSPN